MDIPNFGTGGVRGIAEAEITGELIGKITAAAVTVWQKECGNKAVLIGCDTRRDSRYYAVKAALSAADRGIDAILFDTPIPVPLLSFTLRKSRYCGGIMITASHNPKEYNGIKLYNAKGGQLTPGEIAPISRQLKHNLPQPTGQRGNIYTTGKAEKDAYLTAICRRHAPRPLTVVATPLHGSGKELLHAALSKAGHNVISVPCQEICDGRFTTVSAPNPEDITVFRYGEAIARETAADLVLALDGDGDRCGCLFRCGQTYLPMNGNEIAAFLLSYLLPETAPSAGNYIVRTAVSGTTGEKIAADYGVKTKIKPTGFKYIGEELLNSHGGTFLGGYEESCGFLWGCHTADKDGIATAVLLAEATTCYKAAGKTPQSVLTDICTRYGKETTATECIPFPQDYRSYSADRFLKQFRHSFPQLCREEYDTLFCDLDESTKIALRPSGTEPKLKIYYLLSGENGEQKLRTAKAFIKKELTAFLPRTYSANSGVER